MTHTAEYVGQVVSKFVMPEGSQWPGNRSIEVVVIAGDVNDIPLGATVTVILSSNDRSGS
jgi:hypothetical protein